jgi:hypothetical protein
MQLGIFALGIAFAMGSLILLIIKRTTPRNKRVLVKPWVTYSHESVQFYIILMAAIDIILIVMGLFL